MDLHARRADSFGAQAEAYAEHRPDYPVAAIRWALEPLGSSERLEVLDLAAGTGKLTAGLVAEGHQVTAVEPNEQMLSELVRRVHGVRALPGHAEHIPVPDQTVDAVFVGTAYHWFDQEKALPEIARVLRPGGVLAALWISPDPDLEWYTEFERVSASSVESQRNNPATIRETLNRLGFTVEYFSGDLVPAASAETSGTGAMMLGNRRFATRLPNDWDLGLGSRRPG